jgi:hypothetical protein
MALASAFGAATVVVATSCACGNCCERKKGNSDSIAGYLEDVSGQVSGEVVVEERAASILTLGTGEQVMQGTLGLAKIMGVG